MFAADKSDRIAAVRVRMREERAAATVWSYAVTKAIAVALNPVPVADILGGSTVDVAMVATLAKVYGITLTTANARALVDAIVKAAGWILLTEAVTHFAAALFKGLTLGQGTVLTALPQGAAAGYGSFIVGQAARYYFAHGASWGHEAPKTVVTQILELTDKESVLGAAQRRDQEEDPRESVCWQGGIVIPRSATTDPDRKTMSRQGNHAVRPQRRFRSTTTPSTTT